MVSGKKKRGIFALAFCFIITGNLYAMESSTIEDTVKKMSNTQKIGRMIMLDFRNWKKQDDTEKKAVIEMNDEIRDIVKKYCVGSIILFAQNFLGGQEKSKKLSEDFKSLGVKLIATDQEGGKVQRIISDKGIYKNNGKIENKEEAYQKGVDIAKECLDWGVNVVLAPVADVNSNPNNPVIGVRSFGDNPKYVADCCSAFVKGAKEHGVICVGKHFPGHGDTLVDSHEGLPTVNKTEEELQDCEFIPFKRLIDENIDMIMTAHILLPNIDNGYPATLSEFIDENIDMIMIAPILLPVLPMLLPMLLLNIGKGCPATLSEKILTGILRNKLKYDGIIITDAMNMRAIKDNFGPLEACKLAIQAGADILLMPLILRSEEDICKLKELYSCLEKEIETNPEFKKRVDESVARVLKLERTLNK
jgi:beta-N-acetylhexosaminidase